MHRRAFERVGIRPSDRHDGPVWDLAAPAVLALAADPLLGVVDTAFVGRLGPEALVRLRQGYVHSASTLSIESRSIVLGLLRYPLRPLECLSLSLRKPAVRTRRWRPLTGSIASQHRSVNSTCGNTWPYSLSSASLLWA